MINTIILAVVLFLCGYAVGTFVANLVFNNLLENAKAEMRDINRNTETKMKQELLSATAEMEKNYRKAFDDIVAMYEKEIEQIEANKE